MDELMKWIEELKEWVKKWRKKLVNGEKEWMNE